jgi:hypothetical protein
VLAEADDVEFWRALQEPWTILGTAPVATVIGETTVEGTRVEWMVSTWRLECPSIRNPERVQEAPRDGLLLNPFAVSLDYAATTRASAFHRVVPGVRKKVIASPSEQAELVRLQARFTECLVVPQLPLVAAIDFDALVDHLSAAALSYLKWSRVDFGVLDGDTHELLRVVEVQAGAHHDTADREQKDRWKRDACALAGIEFEEVM